jgi:hypothetical protein
LLRFWPIVFYLERANQLSLLPYKDLVDLCPLIESYQVTKNQENSIDLDEDFLGSDLEDDLVSSPEKSYSNGTTTDLVRLYLQDIGRVPLLKRDEEVEQAQQVQRHRKFGSETPPF